VVAAQLCDFAGEADRAVGEGVEVAAGYAGCGDCFCHFGGVDWV
jgi:hypothetical protein